MKASESLRLIKEIKSIHLSIRQQIIDRLNEFHSIRMHGSDRELFQELVFCILTPQSRARNAEKAIVKLCENNLLYNGNFKEISEILTIVRFKNNKARYVLYAREKFSGTGGISLRDRINISAGINDLRTWLVENIMGIGYKEASHYLRNIGYGEDIAILDRHVLRNMVSFGIIEKIPSSINYLRYQNYESMLKNFSREIDIPLSHLDFVLLYKEIGDIFK